MKPEVIVTLNEGQNVGRYHPMTCPHRDEKTHGYWNGDLGALVATHNGWICPFCDYTQPYSTRAKQESPW